MHGLPGGSGRNGLNAINQDDERKVFSKEEEATTCSP